MCIMHTQINYSLTCPESQYGRHCECASFKQNAHRIPFTSMHNTPILFILAQTLSIIFVERHKVSIRGSVKFYTFTFFSYFCIPILALKGQRLKVKCGKKSKETTRNLGGTPVPLE